MEQSLIPLEEEHRYLESVIERGRQTFIEVGTALMTIREKRTYRTDGYDTFEEYCQNRWGWTARRANQLMDAAEVVQQIGTIVPMPANEAQVRELARLPDPESRREVWREVTEQHGEAVTAAKIRDTVRALNPELNSPRERARAEQEQGDRYLSVALQPDGPVARNAPRMAFLRDLDAMRNLIKGNPAADVVPGLTESDRIYVRNALMFTVRKWCDEMEREMGAGIRAIGGNRG